ESAAAARALLAEACGNRSHPSRQNRDADGFEVRESHQAPCASGADYVRTGSVEMGGRVARGKRGESGVVSLPAVEHDRVEEGCEARPFPAVDRDDRGPVGVELAGGGDVLVERLLHLPGIQARVDLLPRQEARRDVDRGGSRQPLLLFEKRGGQLRLLPRRLEQMRSFAATQRTSSRFPPGFKSGLHLPSSGNWRESTL